MKDWIKRIPLLQENYHLEMLKKVATRRKSEVVYPEQAKIFYALEQTSFDDVRVVILGQDPYHGPGQAHGLAFSVPEGVKAPPTLVNIFKEISADIYQGKRKAFNTDLTRWAAQGILLLNTVLTVQQGKAGAHRKLGWQQFSDEIIAELSEQKESLVFLLWGNPAREKKPLIDAEKHLILEAPHPSPLSAFRGFLGCRHFSQTNKYLQEQGMTPVEW